jgi:nucleoside-diphosphate-sugar epimerase
MIVGNGLIAKAYKNYNFHNNILIFASGVSNSKEFKKKEFAKERDLLIRNLDKKKKIIYFSTFGIEESLTLNDYMKHKLNMEKIVRTNENYLIFRLPQLAGNSTNKNTLLNYFYNKIITDKKIYLFLNHTRNIIDVLDVVKITKYFIEKKFSNTIINVGNKKYFKVIKIVEIMSSYLKKKPKIEIIKAKKNNEVHNINLGLSSKKIKINFDKNYLARVIKKYY